MRERARAVRRFERRIGRSDCRFAAMTESQSSAASPARHRRCRGSRRRCRISCADRRSRARHAPRGGRACRHRRPAEPGLQRADADAEQAEGGAVDLLRQHFARRPRRSWPASCVGAWIDCERVRWRKSAVFSFSVTVRAGKLAVLQPRRDLLATAATACFSSVAKSRDVGLERGFARDRSWRSRSGIDARGRRCRARAATAAGLRRRSGASARSRRRAADRR